ncbi:MAG: ABC transporter ATP-binding protein/permease [Clostridia bacterium]|nr:ABC transporter ATP-binding protein/permease [Clostridia bacterium]
MLKLENIHKIYKTGNSNIEALKGISIEFRKSEFVSVLGQSGCGKTTLLNIIGGLDRYDEGVLSIKDKSTKEYKDRDWDYYRNHSVGFVFQSYNLIPHQTVLQNVELALTISGISAKKRRKMAIEALERVGLSDQLKKKPNQMSGGQMQRVAIARALVNNPEILLADEPTGALDSETSLQIMDLLKEISSDRLVIMVTHNPELAEKYSTRIVKLLDGRITDDSNPYSSETETELKSEKTKGTSMSFYTALSLSLKNLFTKKARTFLTSFAGSIGIIGIALILSLSSGVNAYINRVEEDTLSSYPLMIEESSTDINEMITSLMENKDKNRNYKKDTIYSNDIMSQMMTSMINGSTTNDLEAFKKYLESGKSDIKDYVTDIKYLYKTQINIFTEDGYQVNPSQVFEKMGFKQREENSGGIKMSSSFTNTEIWHELLDNSELLKKQYEIVAGKMPKNYNEVVLIIDKNNEISDYTLYSLGIKDADELSKIIKDAMDGKKIKEPKQTNYSYDDILKLKFKLLLNTDFYEKTKSGTYEDKSKDEIYMLEKLKKGTEVKVVGILRPSEENKTSIAGGTVGYLSSLMTTLIERNNNSAIVKKQEKDKDTDVFTGLPFKTDKEFTMNDIDNYITTLPAEEQAKMKGYIAQMRAGGLKDDEIVKKFSSYLENSMSESTYDDNLLKLGVANIDLPSGISIYPKDFESKDKISDIINNYNKSKDENNRIKYTDYVGLMMSSVTTIINAITYILIAFVSISLIVSSIMIGIITYISVLERTKEIGVLRAMGASKRDVSNIFNAETLIVGFASGTLGILVTILLLIPINKIIKRFTDIAGLAVLPIKGAIILIIISMILTLIAGLIPSRIAAKKDPVISLRSE